MRTPTPDLQRQHVDAEEWALPWICMKHELLQMDVQGGGAIVNCGSAPAARHASSEETDFSPRP
jgi:hypothetical protein